MFVVQNVYFKTYQIFRLQLKVSAQPNDGQQGVGFTIKTKKIER